jgi:hypothetical protein
MADDRDDDLYESVSAMADRIGLEGRERQDYIHEHMTRAGYDAVPQYVRREEEEEGRGSRRGSGFFGSGSGSGSSSDRDRDRGSGQKRRSRDRSRGDDTWYE